MQSSTPSTGVRRLGAVVGPALLGAFVLASCGGGETGATQSTLALSGGSTAFIVRPPATTEPPTDTGTADPGSVVEGTQNYTVQSGDAWYVLVTRFEVTLDDLLAVNEWTNINTFPNPGDVILIPPGGKSVDAIAAGTPSTGGDTSTDGSTEGSTDETATATIPDAGDNCPAGKHVIVEGDYLGKVAGKYDVTVEALKAANANTPGFAAFYPGLEIIIPAKADC